MKRLNTILATAASLSLLATAANANATLTESGVSNQAPKLGHGEYRAPAAATVGSTHVLGDLTIERPFSRATLPNAPVAGGFMTVTNAGADGDRLIAASTDISGRVEIHEMAMVGDVMKMRQLEDGLPIPAGETVELKPGGYHLMFMDLSRSLTDGQTFDVTLVFEKAGEVEIPVSVVGRAVGGQARSQHGMGSN